MTGKNQTDSFWTWGLAGAAVAMAISMFFMAGYGVASVAIGAAIALAHMFLLKRMAVGALARGLSGKQLYALVLLKCGARFLLTAALLAILIYSGWLAPLGFVIGFTVVVLAVLAWGCGKLLLGAHDPL